MTTFSAGPGSGKSAVKMGRRIFINLKKAMAYLLAIHVPIAGMSLIPVLFDVYTYPYRLPPPDYRSGMFNRL
jgi:magnesium-transporting ATPase (P-type)